MKNILIITGILSSLAMSTVSTAHHSFAIYDLENKTEIKGVLTKVSYRSPHILFELAVEGDDGHKTQWQIESMNPSRWQSFDFPHPDEIATVGEEITIIGWAARNGDSEMALSTIITERGETEIRDFIRQGQAQGANGMGNAAMAMGG